VRQGKEREGVFPDGRQPVFANKQILACGRGLDRDTNPTIRRKKKKKKKAPHVNPAVLAHKKRRETRHV